MTNLRLILASVLLIGGVCSQETKSPSELLQSIFQSNGNIDPSLFQSVQQGNLDPTHSVSNQEYSHSEVDGVKKVSAIATHMFTHKGNINDIWKTIQGKTQETYQDLLDNAPEEVKSSLPTNTKNINFDALFKQAETYQDPFDNAPEEVKSSFSTNTKNINFDVFFKQAETYQDPFDNAPEVVKSSFSTNTKDINFDAFFKQAVDAATQHLQNQQNSG